MRRYLKIDGNECAVKLLALDLNKTELQLHSSKIDVGYVANVFVKELLHKKKLVKEMQCNSECKQKHSCMA
jgi:hypothetical protein